MDWKWKRFMSSGKGDGVFYVGHSSAIVSIDDKLIALDPVWDCRPYGEPWEFVPPQVNCDAAIGVLSDCIVSHIHQDHLCEEILRRVPGELTIMGGRPLLEARLSMLRPVRSIPHFQWHPMAYNSVDAYFLPHAFNGVDSSVFLRSRRTGYTVYHGNDNFLSKELIARVVADVGRVDVALLPYAFIHWYPWLMENMSFEEKAFESDRLKAQSLQQAYDFMDAVRPAVTVPFGASLFYSAPLHHPLNKYLATPFELAGAVPMMPGDFILGQERIGAPIVEAEYLSMLEGELSDKQPEPMDLFCPTLGLDLSVISRRLENARRHGRHVVDHRVAVNEIVMDLETLDILDWHPKSMRTQPYTEFNLDRPVFLKWIRGEITFEEAIGTRRFTCVREPNVYRQEVFEWINNFL